MGLQAMQRKTRRETTGLGPAAPGKETPKKEVDQPRHLKQARNRIVGGKYGRLERLAERAEVIAEGKPASHDFHDCDGKVRVHPNPATAGTSVQFRDCLATDHPPQEIGKIDSHARAQSVPAPHARVYVEQLQTAIARVALEFNLDQTGVTGRLEEPKRRLDDTGIVNGLDVGAE